MKLYVVGIGPGDPELLTLKAKNILEKISLIFYPTGGKNRTALSIIEKIVDLKHKTLIPLHFPMKKTRNTDLNLHWQKLAETILKNLEFFKEAVFITLGDPSFYCTFFYLYPFLRNKIKVKIIPGVSSINACACAIPVSLALGDETIAIIPANYVNRIKNLLYEFNTIIFMKPHKSLNKILDFLEDEKFQVYGVKNASSSEEKIFLDIDDFKKEDLNYFTTIIVRKK